MGGNKNVYGLDSFKTFEKLVKDIRNENITVDEAEIKQNKFAEKLDELRAYTAREYKCIDLKKSVFKNAKNFSDGWEKIVNGFKNGILPLSKGIGTKADNSDQQIDILETPEQKKKKDLSRQIKKEQKYIDLSLFEGGFGYDAPDKMLQALQF